MFRQPDQPTTGPPDGVPAYGDSAISTKYQLSTSW